MHTRFEDCNHNPVDGCETPLTTSSNCGGCGIPCNLVGGTSDCSSGSCQLTGCYAPYGNCDGYGGNGCETPLTTIQIADTVQIVVRFLKEMQIVHL